MQLSVISVLTYKNRVSILTVLRKRYSSIIESRDLEKSVYEQEYRSVVQEKLPEIMREKAERNLNKKYNKTPILEKLSKISENFTLDSRNEEQKGRNRFDRLLDDLNVLNWRKSENFTLDSRNEEQKGRNRFDRLLDDLNVFNWRKSSDDREEKEYE